MAINPSVQLAPDITAPDADYTYGSAKNETAPGNLDGTPYKKVRADDIFGFQQALLRSAGIVPSGSADTQLASQYLQSLLHQVLTGGTLVDTGIVNVYQLDPQTNNIPPVAYKNGQVVIFVSTSPTNTGACTAQIASLGAKALKRLGSDAVAGDFPAGATVVAIYNSGLGWFEGFLLDREINAATTTVAGILKTTTKALQEAGTDNFVTVTPGRQQYHPSASKAWVTFDGSGTVSIKDEYNVSSVTDNGTGDYTINFTNNFSDNKYAFVGSAEDDTSSGDAFVGRPGGGVKTTAAMRIKVHEDSQGALDSDEVCVVFFGDQ